MKPLIDTFDRVHDNLRLSVTDRCNIRCFYCMPETGVKFQPREQLLTFEEIELPVAVPAAASRTLRVSMVCWDADLQRAQFQLECREPGHCIPFLAYADAGRSTTMGSQKIAGSACRSASRTRTTGAPPHKDLIRVGDHATVIFGGGQFHLTALVTCLERGAEGAIIRVRNRDGQIFRARVSAPARLEALTQ
jgi:hypothetical protein